MEHLPSLQFMATLLGYWLGGWLLYMHVMAADVLAVQAGRREPFPLAVRLVLAVLWPAVTLWLVLRLRATPRAQQ